MAPILCVCLLQNKLFQCKNGRRKRVATKDKKWRWVRSRDEGILSGGKQNKQEDEMSAERRQKHSQKNT
jgi:hypothetical protein